MGDNVKFLSKDYKFSPRLNVIVNEYCGLVYRENVNNSVAGSISVHSIAMDTSRFSENDISTHYKKAAHCGLHVNFVKKFSGEPSELLNKAFFNMPDVDGSYICAVYVSPRSNNTILMNGCEGFDCKSREMAIKPSYCFERELPESIYTDMIKGKMEQLLEQEWKEHYFLVMKPYIVTYAACVDLDENRNVVQGERGGDIRDNGFYFWTLHETSEHPNRLFTIKDYERHCTNVKAAQYIERQNLRRI